MDKYIHINDILKYVNIVEKEEFQIIKSEDFGVVGDMAFKAIIPKKFKVNNVKVSDFVDGAVCSIVSIEDKKGRNAMDMANVLLWNSELYSTKDETAVCILDSDIENGLLLFENFKRIPLFVTSNEILDKI